MFPAVHGVVSQGGKGAAPEPPVVTPGGPAVVNLGSWSSQSTSNQRGWVFTPSRDITIVSLMLYDAANISETVTIWRNDTDAIVAQEVVTANGGWGETPLTTPVTLLEGAEYTIARWAGGATRTYSREASNAFIDPSLTVIKGVLGTTGDRPTGSNPVSEFSSSFRTAADPDGWRYFRLSILDNNGDSGMGLSTFGIAETVNGVDLAPTEATITPHAGATVSGTGSFEGLIDNDTRTGAFRGNWSPPWEVVLDFGSSNQKEAVEHLIGAYHGTVSTAARSPSEWKLYGSNDRETWTELAHVTGETNWVIDEVRRYAT